MPREPIHWEKSPADLVERFDGFVGRFLGAADVERRKMFGYPALFVGGNLATGLHQSNWMVRLAEAEQTELLALPGSGPFEPMPGRAMKGYTNLPGSVIDDDAELERWVQRAIDFGRTLPPKK